MELKGITVDKMIDLLSKYRDEHGGDDVCCADSDLVVYDVKRFEGKCNICFKEMKELVRDSYPKYPLFADGEYGVKYSQYRGYVIEASYDDEGKVWEVDAFDRENRQYVMYPLERDVDFDDAIANTIKRIDHKLKKGSGVFLIYGLN